MPAGEPITADIGETIVATYILVAGVTVIALFKTRPTEEQVLAPNAITAARPTAVVATGIVIDLVAIIATLETSLNDLVTAARRYTGV